jgi:Flp pilus assembly protein TadD
LQLNPAYAEARNNLANALARVGRNAEARFHYQEAIRLKPEMPEAHYNYARLLAGLGEIEAARVRALEALRIHPDYAEAIEFLKTLPPAR